MRYSVSMSSNGTRKSLGFFVGTSEREAIKRAHKIYGGALKSYSAAPDDYFATEAELKASLKKLPSGGEIPWRIWTERGDKAVSSAMLTQFVDKGLLRVKPGNGDNYGHDRWFKL